MDDASIKGMKRHMHTLNMNLLTGGEDSGDDSASLGTSNGLQLHRILCGGAELSHVVRTSSGAQDHLLIEETHYFMLYI